ncbi:MAG: beta-ketoacyl-ACP reductase [Micavibrio sp.]|nr:beta-ketoacyl-ACP reductase [Micavibrio sp.]
MKNVEQKIAIVTGGTRGIGKSISESLIKQGCKVFAFYGGNDKAAKDFELETGAKAMKVDVTDFDACEKAVEKILKAHKKIDILVNNAGITRDGMLHKSALDSWQSVIDTNLNSLYNMCRHVVPSMRETRFGRVINISSINGQKGQLGQANYSAAKAGMLGFTKALALESAGRGITVNAICPGYINTDMTADMPHEILESIVRSIPVGRLGKPEEIAGMVAYLASEDAGFITGATMTVNGGQYMAA